MSYICDSYSCMNRNEEAVIRIRKGYIGHSGVHNGRTVIAHTVQDSGQVEIVFAADPTGNRKTVPFSEVVWHSTPAKMFILYADIFRKHGSVLGEQYESLKDKFIRETTSSTSLFPDL